MAKYLLSITLYILALSPAFAGDCRPVFWVHHIRMTPGYSVYEKSVPVPPGQKALGEGFIAWIDEDNNKAGPAPTGQYASGFGTLCGGKGSWSLK